LEEEPSGSFIARSGKRRAAAVVPNATAAGIIKTEKEKPLTDFLQMPIMGSLTLL